MGKSVKISKIKKLTSANTTKEVNKIYKVHTPSLYKYIQNKKTFENFIKEKEKFFLNKLKLPTSIFKNKEVLDLGSGTGINSSCFAIWGAKLTLVEYDKFSFSFSKNFYKKTLKKKATFINSDIFLFKTKKKFDFVHCNGVLHHTSNTKLGIKMISSFLKKGGFFIFCNSNTSAYFQRHLQRFTLFKISKNNDDIYKFSKLLFSENIRRAKKFGQRSTDSIIYDNYLNPKIDTCSYEEILKLFKKNKLNLYNSHPPYKEVIDLVSNNITTQFYNHSQQNPQSFSIAETKWLMNKYDERYYDKNLKFLIKMKKEQDTILNLMNNMPQKLDINKFIKKIKNYRYKIKSTSIDIYGEIKLQKFYAELNSYLNTLAKTNNPIIIRNKIKSFKILFRGQQGVGEVFTIGYKTI